MYRRTVKIIPQHETPQSHDAYVPAMAFKQVMESVAKRMALKDPDKVSSLKHVKVEKL